jgi:NAD(P)-dependent dehydrogenase (short-subunit alcohol dehydrogenase family)
MSPAAPSHEVTEELFDKVVGLNFKGSFRLASQVAKWMADGDGGVIINVSSTGGMMPLPAVVPYGASKAVLNAMGLSLAHEYAPKVRVNTLSAGPSSRILPNPGHPSGARLQKMHSIGQVNPKRSSRPHYFSRARRRVIRRVHCCASMAASSDQNKIKLE